VSDRRIFISTGEVSGDLQGAWLIDALFRQAAEAGIELEILALGGDRMAAAGAKLLGQTSGIGSVGLFESLPFVVPTWQIQRRAQQELQRHPPDLIVLIDYMGPNLNIGSYARRHLPQVPVVYYIAPQMWVWSISQRSTDRIVEMSDRMLAIFTEEARYFEQRGASVQWVGHPLVDRLQASPSRDAARAALGIDADTIAIALLPASRRQELRYLMPAMFEAARAIQQQVGQVRFWIPLSLQAYRDPIEAAIDRYGLRATVECQRNREVLAGADLAIAKSGTVNLELALLNVPQVVLYRVNPVTAWIARKLLGFSIPFMSPTNLVQMKSVVPELLQEEATPENIVKEVMALMPGTPRRSQMLADYRELKQCAGEVGVSDRAATEILRLL
jgi:lipid-A-disaccharide synthase